MGKENLYLTSCFHNSLLIELGHVLKQDVAGAHAHLTRSKQISHRFVLQLVQVSESIFQPQLRKGSITFALNNNRAQQGGERSKPPSLYLISP